MKTTTKRKIVLVAITLPVIVITLVLVPIVSIFQGFAHAVETTINSFVEIKDQFVISYRYAWRDSKEPDNNFWDDEDTWGAQ